MRTLISIIFLSLLFSCSEKRSSELDFLAGTWKIENKEQYEVWKKINTNEFSGSSYKLKGNQRITLEYLSIKTIGNQITYTARVPDQNSGKEILFTLNNEIKTQLSFENPKHDFPKKIQYHKISESIIDVKVLGNNDEGFSYSQIKQ